MAAVRTVVVAMLLLAPALLRADPPKVRLRMAAIAPEGTAWARELKALSRDIESSSGGQVEMKWYLGGIAGDEQAAIERIQKGQLDGIAGASFCERLGPSLRVTRIVGLFQNRDETRHVIARLRPTIDAEFDKKGFVNLGMSGFGNAILFSRTPVRSMAELRQGKYFIWELDDVWIKLFPEMGVHTVPLPVTEAARAYDEGRTDGFIVVPSGALAFQWSTRAKYFSELRAGFLPGCVTIAHRAFDALPIASQQAIRTAVAKFMIRFEDVGRATDAALLGGLFEKQGLQRVPVSASFLAEFLDQARQLRDKTKVVSQETLSQVQGWLADYRAEHPR
jgi:TRAP-type transport system periplasmic protein